MLCKKCGNPISDDAAFCPKCGTAVPPPTTGNTVEIEPVTTAANTSKGKVKVSEVIYNTCEDLILKFLTPFAALHALGWGIGMMLFSVSSLPYYHEGIILISFLIAACSVGLNFNKILEASKIDGPKTPFYKHPKFWMIVVALVVVGIVSNIFDTSTPEGELRDYVKNKMPIIMLAEGKVNSALNEIIGENFTDEMTAYAALKHEIVPNAQKWLEDAEGVRVEGERLKEIHDKYINYASVKLETLELYLAVFENQDEYAALTSVEKMEESNILVAEYISEINAYCDELGVESGLELEAPASIQPQQGASSYIAEESTADVAATDDQQVSDTQPSADDAMTQEEAQEVMEAWLEAHPFPGGALPEYAGSDEEGFVFTVQFDQQYMFSVRSHDAGVVAVNPDTDAAMPAEYWYEAITSGQDPWGTSTTEEQPSETVYYVANPGQPSVIILEPNGNCSFLATFATGTSYYYGYYTTTGFTLTLYLMTPDSPLLVEVVLPWDEDMQAYNYSGENISNIIFNGDKFELSSEVPSLVQDNAPNHPYQRGDNLALVTAEPSLRMRMTPDTEGEIVTQIPFGELVETPEVFDLTNPWTYVYYLNEDGGWNEGWVSTEYLRVFGTNYTMH